VKLNIPGLVGVPANTPSDDNVMPAGGAPEVTVKV
jgi:hypothetical protein